MDKIKVRIPEVLSDGQLPPEQEALLDAMEAAGWSDDPTTGKAVLLPDGSEMLNPTPIAPPVDYDASPDAFTLWQRNLQRLSNIRDLGDGFVLDETDAEANDFEVDDPEDFFVRSVYEFEMVPEAPSLQRAGITSNAPAKEVSSDAARDQAIADGNVGK